MKLTPTLLLLAFPVVLATACNKSAPSTPNYADAINSYYQAHPACLFSSEKRFPVQVSPDDAKSQGYDALVDQGLLARSTSEKKIVIISKRELNYDLTDQGRSNWTADPSQPGYGNFCYGHPKVATVDSNTPTSNQPGATVTVNYHYTVTGLPSWASAAETQTAFPALAAAANPQPATASLTNTSNGWQVASVSSSSTNSTPATPADGKIAQ